MPPAGVFSWMEIVMTARRIDPKIIARIEQLLRTSPLSCRKIAIITGVSHGLVNDLKSGVRAAKHAAAELSAAMKRQAAPHLGKPYHRCSCGASARLPIGVDVCLACQLHSRQRQGTPIEDVSLDLDLKEEHRGGYEEMRIRAEARHKAGAKNSESGM